jgi:hypothetical protein
MQIERGSWTQYQSTELNKHTTEDRRQDSRQTQQIADSGDHEKGEEGKKDGGQIG